MGDSHFAIHLLKTSEYYKDYVLGYNFKNFYLNVVRVWYCFSFQRWNYYAYFTRSGK